MGVLYDYFRAPDDDTVRALMAATGGHALDPAAHPDTGVLDLKGLDPTVVLGKLVGFVRDEAWRTDLVTDDLVWPGPAEVDHREYEGPWVLVLGQPARDTLAGIGAGQVPGLAARWAGIEEFAVWPPEPEQLESVITELAALARDASANGEQIYCWCSL